MRLLRRRKPEWIAEPRTAHIKWSAILHIPEGAIVTSTTRWIYDDTYSLEISCHYPEQEYGAESLSLVLSASQLADLGKSIR